MVSEDFFMIFLSLWEQISTGVVVANMNPRGMVGRICVVNHILNIEAAGEDFLKIFSIIQ